MTSPAAIKSRDPRRLGLYGPFVALAIAVIAWSGMWLWLCGQVARRLDEAKAQAARTGHHLDWGSRRIDGYPFRLNVDFTDVVFRDPSGWGVSAKSLKTEARAYAPDHWVAVAPLGVILTRPVGGEVVVGVDQGGVLRASLSDRAAHPATVSVEGINLTFTPAPNAAPFILRSVRGLHIHTKAGPGDQGAFYFEIESGNPWPGSLLARIAADGRLNFVADGLYSHASALAGPAWDTAVDAWSRAGGKVTVRQLRLRAADAVLEAGAGGAGVRGLGPAPKVY